MSIDSSLALTLHTFLALLLCTSAVHKAAHWDRVKAAIVDYRVLPKGFESAATWLVAATEMALGAALVIPGASRLASVGAVGLFTVYLALLVLSLLRGRQLVNCGCSFHRGAAPLSGVQVARNGVVEALAVAASLPVSQRSLNRADWLQVAAAVLCLALLYWCVELMQVNNAYRPARGARPGAAL